MQHATHRLLLYVRRRLVQPQRLFRAMATSASRTYGDAIDALNSLQTPYAVIEARRKAGVKPGELSLQEMRTYLTRLGHSLTDLNRLNIIHVAGTKGKGSTCAFVDSILSQYRKASGRPSKTGLLVSPHLIAVRERIRIDSQPISETLFAKYFFDMWDKLGAHNSDTPEAAELDSRPAYARYLTLLSYHVFLAEGVEVAVIETGIGGAFDATNIVEQPVASGITTLGIDHVYVLGDTVEKIAWHKAGIMKKGCAAFTVEQLPGAAEVLQQQAKEKGVKLKVLGVDSRLQGVKIRPDAQFQKKNASLAVALAETALTKLDPSFALSDVTLPQEFVGGLENVVWHGRCEVVKDPNSKVVWHVDGAHTADSLKMASRWFVDATRDRKGPRALVFNQQGRAEALNFLTSIHKITQNQASRSFDCVIFCTNVTYAATGYKRDFVQKGVDPMAIEKMTVQRAFAERWAELDPLSKVSVLPTIEEAIDSVRALSGELTEDETVQAFVTGSFHLVGGALGILKGADAL